VDYLLRLVRQWPDWFLDELLDLLKTNRFISVHYVTIHRELVHAGASLKKLKKIVSERKEEGRHDFMNRMAQYSSEELSDVLALAWPESRVFGLAYTGFGFEKS